MVSDFLVEHPSGPFFELSEQEWKLATEKYKALTENSGVNYLNRTATASINIGTDSYFDNETILSQFERLFQMLEFKQAYKDHQVEVVVDNARTHTAKMYSLQDFRRGIGGYSPVDKIEYIDANGVRQVIDCYFQDGPNTGKSKGLVEICKDLGVTLLDYPKPKLAEIQNILSKHPAFQNVSCIDFVFSNYIVFDIIHYFSRLQN